MQPISEILTPSEVEITRKLLFLSTDGSLFPDWEFETLFGVEQNAVREVADAFPLISMELDLFQCAVCGALGNILGYPHNKSDEIESRIEGTMESVRVIFEKTTAAGY